jgi:hypothetical protein
MMRKRNTDLLIMASDILGDRSILEHIREIELLKLQGQVSRADGLNTWGPNAVQRWTQDPESDERWYWKTFWRRTQTEMFNQYIRLRSVYDLFLLVGPEGQLVTCSTVNPDGSLLSQKNLTALFSPGKCPAQTITYQTFYPSNPTAVKTRQLDTISVLLRRLNVILSNGIPLASSTPWSTGGTSRS